MTTHEGIDDPDVDLIFEDLNNDTVHHRLDNDDAVAFGAGHDELLVDRRYLLVSDQLDSHGNREGQPRHLLAGRQRSYVPRCQHRMRGDKARDRAAHNARVLKIVCSSRALWDVKEYEGR
jgi:hypothetical protein